MAFSVPAYGYGYWVMTERILCQVHAAELDENFMVWHIATKVAAMKFVKPWILSHSLPNREIPATLVRPSVQNVPEKIGETSTVGYTQGKEAQRLPKDHVEWLTSPTLLGPSWCGASRTIRYCCWPWGISSPKAAAPSTLPKGKTGVKKHEWSFCSCTIEF